MIVMLKSIPVLEADPAVLELDGRGKLCVTQELESAVDCAATYLGMFVMNGAGQLVDRHMPFRLEEGPKYDLALA